MTPKYIPQEANSKGIEIGERLREARESASMTQTEVAISLKVPQSRVAKMEAGLIHVRMAEFLSYSDVIRACPRQLAADLFPRGTPLPLHLPPFLLLEEYFAIMRLIEVDAFQHLATIEDVHRESLPPAQLRRLRNDWLQMELVVGSTTTFNQR